MMSTRRSLFTFGKLAVAAALLVLGPAIVHAQAPAAVDATSITVTPVDHDKLLVGWTAPAAADRGAYEIGYAAHKTATDFIGIKPKMMKAPGGTTAVSAVVSGLTAETRYVIGVRTVNTAADPDVASAWSYADGTADAVTLMTGEPPAPGDVDYRDVTVMPGNMELMVEWERHPTPGATGLEISGYMIEYSTMEDFSSDAKSIEVGAVMMATIANLTNGTEYWVRLKAKNDAGGMSANWSMAQSATPSADAMPTPALPVFGAVALGAGLLAAGRARLRRRAQLQRCREQAQLTD